MPTTKGVARFVVALVQSLGGMPLEPFSFKKKLLWLPGAPLIAGGPCTLHNLHNPLLRHCLLRSINIQYIQSLIVYIAHKKISLSRPKGNTKSVLNYFAVSFIGYAALHNVCIIFCVS